MPVGVDTRECDIEEGAGARAPRDSKGVANRPLDADRPWSKFVLAAVAASVAFGAFVTHVARIIAAAMVRAWPPARHFLIRAAGAGARAAAAGFLVASRGGLTAGRWLVARARRWVPVLAARTVRAARTVEGGIRRHGPDVVATAGSRSLNALGRFGAAAEALCSRGRTWIRRREEHWEPAELRPGVEPAVFVRSIGWAVAIIGLLGVMLVVGGRVAVGGLAAGTVKGDTAAVALPSLPERSELMAADGSSLGVVHGEHGNRVVVPLDAVPKVIIDAVIATEDADFWNHDGIDMRGIARATKRNVDAGEITQGGSTITQQLAKSTLASPKRDLHRKLTEAVLAVRLDHQLGKRRVLERYLNTVFFGQGAYGIAAAVESYFGRPLAEVTVDQAALLAGLIRGPSLYDPMSDPEAARARRATVLGRMVTEGMLSSGDAETAARAPLPTTINRPSPAVGWVADAARAELLADPRLGATPETRAAMVAGGGLRVHTTVDPALQRQAEEAVAGGVPGRADLTAALASVDPSSGAVRALVGGADYAARQFNAASDGAGRQTGSSFKVFTLVAALRAGHVSSEVVDGNSPCPIPNPGGRPNPWLPQNYEGEAFGQLTVVDATVHSSNCAFARLASTVGADGVARTARDMGVSAPLQKVPSMTLGTNTVPPLQMAAAFATLAADGVAHSPHIVARVERREGSVVLSNDGAGRPVIDPQVARVATSVLGQVVTRGTGTAAALGDRPVAGKTGTAQNHQDAWFVGYTPQLATAVWMGDVNGERPMLNVGGINVTGGSYPARIWRRFMAAAHSGLPVVGFTSPAPESATTATAPPPDPVGPTSPTAAPRPRGGKGGKGRGGGKG